MHAEQPTVLLREFTRALEQGHSDSEGSVSIQLSANAASWLHDGAVRFSTGRVSELCTALGLRGAGISLPASQYAMQARNHHLAQAFNLTKGENTNQRCIALSHTIRAFKSRTWRRVRDYREPPSRLTELQRHIFQAFKCCDTVPSSKSRLREILTK